MRLSPEAFGIPVSFKRPSAKNNVRQVTFNLDAPGAQHVSVVGDFNGWNPKAHPMQRQMGHSWGTQVSLPHGHHRYYFVVDGEIKLDPKASGTSRNDRNEKVSLVAIS